MAARDPLVILAPRTTPDSVAIWREAVRRGWRVERLQSWQVPAELNQEAMGRELVLYAEPLFAEAVADQLELVLIEPPPNWLVNLPHRFTKRNITLSTLEKAREIASPTFIKPAEGKTFEPRVYATGGELPKSTCLDDALLVLCSEPVSWIFEARCFIKNRQLMDMSPYWRHDELAVGPDGTWPFLGNEEVEALCFVKTLVDADDTMLPPAFVLDVGITREHGWAVVEGNPCWGAGLYGCSAGMVLDTGRHAVKRRKDMKPTDWAWTSPRLARPLV